MTLGLHQERTRRRRKRRWTLVKWLIGLGAIAAAGLVAYETGSTQARLDTAGLQTRIDELTLAAEQLDAEKAELRAALALAEDRLAEAQARYENEAPTGVLADLLTLVRRKLEEGVDQGRLAFVIEAARNERDCDAVPVEKRFLVATPLSSGGNDSVSFAEGLITVTASGASALNASGKPEAWFDPARDVTLRLTALGGGVEETSGVLPLSVTMVAGDREYRFGASAGPQGFVRIVADSCRYP